jgi:hypothetical protein
VVPQESCSLRNQTVNEIRTCHNSGQEELLFICLLGSKQPGTGEPHYQSLVYTSSLIIVAAAIRDGPYLKNVESKTHPQIAMLARRRTILRRVESSVHHAASFSTITWKFLPRLGEERNAATDPILALARVANAVANPRRNGHMHVVLQAVSEIVLVDHVKGGGESVHSTIMEGPTEPQPHPEEPTRAETGAPDMRLWQLTNV